MDKCLIYSTLQRFCALVLLGCKLGETGKGFCHFLEINGDFWDFWECRNNHEQS